MKINRDALRVIRERSGHSQLSLAKASGVGQSRISEIEAGEVDVRPATVQKLAEALHVPMTALLAAEPAPVAT